MSTTLLFAELLVIGIGTVAWLILLIGAFVGNRPEAGLLTIDTPGLVVLTVVAYVLGIVVDRLARKAFEAIELRLATSILGTSDYPSSQVVEREILLASEALGSQIQYNRSRYRICRAWVFNGALITVAFFVWNFRVRVIGMWPSLGIAAIGVLLCASLIWAARTLARDHYCNLRESYEFLHRRDLGSGS